MNHPSNNHIKKIAIGISAAALLLPTLFAHAAPPVSLPGTSVGLGSSLAIATVSAVTDASFCSVFSGFSDTVLAQIAAAKNSAESKKAEVASQLAQRQAAKDKGISAARSDEDALVKTLFASVEAKAVTKADKTGVKEFEKAVTDTVAIRQDTVNAALSDYRDGLRSALASQQARIDSALSAFQSSVADSVASSKSGCQQGSAVMTLRANLKTGLSSAKVKLAADISAVKDTESIINSLVAKRKSAVLHADQDFRGALNAAKNTLKKSFPAAFKVSVSASATSSAQ